ncbi:MAG: SLBB domain-containing protein [Rubrivivax sp.]|nr:SLBB domain-containing protein [Rubrivivax sp.]
MSDAKKATNSVNTARIVGLRHPRPALLHAPHEGPRRTPHKIAPAFSPGLGLLPRRLQMLHCKHDGAPLERRFVAFRALAAATVVLVALAGGTAQAQSPSGTPAPSPGPTGMADSTAGLPGAPIRLRQGDVDSVQAIPSLEAAPRPGATRLPPAPPARPSEFETFVELTRYGSDLVQELVTGTADHGPGVPADYIIQSGDEILVNIWGSVDADLRLTVDRSGRVTIPRVGPVLVAGLRYDELQPTLSRRVSQTFRNFELSASLGRLRGVRVFVTGFVQRPGAYVVSGLSTVMNAVIRAGGPAAEGSFRSIELRRGGRTVATLDLYDLLLRGDRTGDHVVQPDDVVHVAAVGPQVAVRGSVNKQAVFELRPSETLRDLLAMAGGFSPVADRSRVALERLEARNANRITQLPLPENESMQLANGDMVRVFSAVDSALSVERQNRRVKVEGEVGAPGEYVLPPGSTLADALRAAGGLTQSAYLYGVQFTRESVRLAQIENYDRALRDLETDFIRSSASKRVSTADDAANQAAQSAAIGRLVERLRALKPSGRVVLQMTPDSTTLPDLLVEDQDRIYVPAQPTSVGVFGSVFNAGNYLYSPGRALGDYLRLAGGPTKGADEGSVFVVRANGHVISSRQSAGGFWRSNRIANVPTEPGDTIFVPEELDRSTFLQTARDFTLLLFQLGVGSAGIRSALN